MSALANPISCKMDTILKTGLTTFSSTQIKPVQGCAKKINFFLIQEIDQQKKKILVNSIDTNVTLPPGVKLEDMKANLKSKCLKMAAEQNVVMYEEHEDKKIYFVLPESKQHLVDPKFKVFLLAGKEHPLPVSKIQYTDEKGYDSVRAIVFEIAKQSLQSLNK